MATKKIFISYRREDTGSFAGRVYDRLCKVFSYSNVYFDVSTIKGGEDFGDSIVSAIDRCDAVLVFIGKNWMAARPNGDRPRIWDENDYVRAEVRAALARPILVLPILVDGAQMVRSDLLPSDIKAIATRNAVPLRLETFDNDTENILATIMGTSPRDRPWEGSRNNIVAKIGLSLAGVIIFLVLLGLSALIHFWVLARPLSASIGGAPVTTLLLIIVAFIGALAGLLYESRRRKGRD